MEDLEDIIDAILGVGLALPAFVLVVLIIIVGPFIKIRIGRINKKKLERQIGPFGVAMVTLSAVVGRADRRFDREEGMFVRKFFVHEFGKEYGMRAYEYLLDILPRKIDVKKTCKEAGKHSTYEANLHMMYFLMGIVTVKEQIQERELQAIHFISGNLGISNEDIDSLIAMFLNRHDNTSDSSVSNSSKEEVAYKILCVESDATDAELKKAYRKLVKMHHPDKVAHLGEVHMKIAEEKFEKVQEAWEYLSKIRKL